MTTQEVKDKLALAGKSFADFQKWMIGNAHGMYKDETINWYANDVDHFIAHTEPNTNKQSLVIPILDGELEELKEGKVFEWVFPTDKGELINVTVHHSDGEEE